MSRLPESMQDIKGHDLRRTAATMMAKSGIPEFIISKVLNHTDSRSAGAGCAVTSRHYNNYAYEAEITASSEGLGTTSDGAGSGSADSRRRWCPMSWKDFMVGSVVGSIFSGGERDGLGDPHRAFLYVKRSTVRRAIMWIVAPAVVLLIAIVIFGVLTILASFFI
jgi:hypothetical protein